MNDEIIGTALRQRREQRGLSLRALAMKINYSHVYLWEIEKGIKQPQGDIIARCDDVLQAGGRLVALAARSRYLRVDLDESLGLHLGATWMECAQTVTELWEHDAGRRRFMKAVAFAPAFAIAPETWWATSDTGAENEGTAADSEGESPVAIQQMTTTFKRLDNRYGGGQIRAAVVQYLASTVAPVLHANALDALGPAYLSAVAELTQLAGWLAYDELDHGLGQRYLLQALHIARWADDRPLGSEILAAMSHQAIFLRQPTRAISLAVAARNTAQRCRVPALVAEADLMRAHAYALQKRVDDCLMALKSAEITLSKADPGEHPAWMGYFDEAYFAAVSGHCFRELGHATAAESAAQRSLDMDNSYQRGRLFNELLLAGGHILKSDIEQACVVGHRALDLATDVSSARAITYIDRMVNELRPWHNHRAVKDLVERARMVSL